MMHIKYILSPETPSVGLYIVDDDDHDHDHDGELILTGHSAYLVGGTMWLKGSAENTKANCPDSA